MSIRTETIGNVSVVKITAPVLDALGALPLLATFPAVAMGTRRVVIDAGEVDAVDADGLRALISCWRAARRSRARLAIAGLPSRARLAVRLIGLDRIVPVAADLSEALDAFGVELPAARPLPQLVAS